MPFPSAVRLLETSPTEVRALCDLPVALPASILRTTRCLHSSVVPTVQFPLARRERRFDGLFSDWHFFHHIPWINIDNFQTCQWFERGANFCVQQSKSIVHFGYIAIKVSPFRMLSLNSILEDGQASRSMQQVVLGTCTRPNSDSFTWSQSGLWKLVQRLKKCVTYWRHEYWLSK